MRTFLTNQLVIMVVTTTKSFCARLLIQYKKLIDRRDHGGRRLIEFILQNMHFP